MSVTSFFVGKEYYLKGKKEESNERMGVCGTGARVVRLVGSRYPFLLPSVSC